jgi:aldehyde:ferredoxin oxidoreductase
MKGYTKKVLRINLSNGEIKTEQPDDSVYSNFLGGSGFIIHTLLTEMKKKYISTGCRQQVDLCDGSLFRPSTAGKRKKCGWIKVTPDKCLW